MIRTLDSEDLAYCAKIYTDVFNAPPWNEALDNVAANRRLSFLLGMPDAIGRKAVRGDALAGYWIGYIEPVAHGRDMIIKEVVVAPDMQGKAVGRELMDDVQHYARDRKCSKITLSTSRDAAAFLFYQKLGYNNVDAAASMEKYYCARRWIIMLHKRPNH